MPAPISVEEYLAALEPRPRAVLERLRKAIRAAAPVATETISYGMPTFKLDGRSIVSCAAFKHHVSLFPASGAVREALGEELAPYVTGRGTIRFGMDEPLPLPLVERIVRVRIDEEAARRRQRQAGRRG